MTSMRQTIKAACKAVLQGDVSLARKLMAPIVYGSFSPFEIRALEGARKKAEKRFGIKIATLNPLAMPQREMTWHELFSLRAG